MLNWIICDKSYMSNIYVYTGFGIEYRRIVDMPLNQIKQEKN